MNRQVLQAALGRAECCAPRAPTVNWGTARPFSTSISNYFQDSRNYNEGDKPRFSNPAIAGRQQRSDTAVQKLAGLTSRPRQAPEGLSDSIGPRTARPPVSGPFGSPQGLGSPQVLASPRILNMRSLRGTLRGGTRGGLRGGPTVGGPRPGMLGRRAPLAGSGARGGPGGRGGFRGRGGRGGAAGRGERKKKKKQEFSTGEGKLTWNLEEQAVFDRIEQGEVVPFVPKLAPDNLSGYGPALATDAPIGKVETVLRTMRMISGGQAFNSDSGVTVDAKAMRRRYHHEKKPVFFNSMAEKEWAERAEPNWKVRAPSEATKKAMIDLAVRGLYPETKPVADLTDVQSVIANYHGRTWTYRTEDSQKFLDKVLATLPEDMKNKPAPATQAKAKKTA